MQPSDPIGTVVGYVDWESHTLSSYTFTLNTFTHNIFTLNTPAPVCNRFAVHMTLGFLPDVSAFILKAFTHTTISLSVDILTRN